MRIAVPVLGSKSHGVSEAGPQVLQNLKNDPDIQQAIAAMVEKWCEYIPDFCRAVFRLVDLDDSGIISEREVELLRALTDAFLHLENPDKDDILAYAIALFNAIDRNGDNM